jgi:Zn-dependent protease
MILFANFGWGKPVEFDPYNLRSPRRDAAIIALSGPVSNFIMAGISSLIYLLIINMPFYIPSNLFNVLLYFITFLFIFGSLNITLGIFNLIPIKPLDGSHIVRALIPEESVRNFDFFMNRFGVILLLLLILPIFGAAPITYIMFPITEFLSGLLFPL